MWRRASERSDTAVEDTGPVVAGDDPTAPKGKPTPKRRDAELARKASLTGPSDTKSMRKAERERQRTDRERARQAMMAGDPRALPPRDQGPVKLFVRNYVDSRRTISEAFVPVAVLVLVLSLMPNPEVKAAVMLAWIVILLLAVLENLFLIFMLRREIGRKFGADASMRGVSFYALMRNLQIRRLRLPPPQMRPGGKPVKPRNTGKKP